MAGTGAASADLIYATLAAMAGELVASHLSPYAQILQISSAAVLILLGAVGLWRAGGVNIDAEGTPGAGDGDTLRGTFIRFLGLTLLNPQTIAYFGALILGRDSGNVLTPAGKIAFVIGAALASWSWQSSLAIMGAVARQRMGPSFQHIATIFGNLLVLALGLRIVVQLLN